jgi:hypothetical protein
MTAVYHLIDFIEPPPPGIRYYRPAPYGPAAGVLQRVVDTPDGPRLVWRMTCCACGRHWEEITPLRRYSPLPSHCRACLPTALRQAGRLRYGRLLDRKEPSHV